MKRRGLIRDPQESRGELFRVGAKHSVYVNRKVRKSSTIPRHREINEGLARKICRDLEVPNPERSGR